MNKRFFTYAIATTLLVTGIGLSACNEDNSWEPTGVNGRPSVLLTDGKLTRSYAYNGNRPEQIQYPDGQSIRFEYDGETLSGLSFTPSEGVADGHAWVEFTANTDGTWLIRSGGEPDWSNCHQALMELDETGLPVRITSQGYFQTGSEGEKQLQPGNGYTLFHFDTAARQLIGMESFDANGKRQSSYTFTYDNAPGSFSRLELPEWFIAWWSYRYRQQLDFPAFLFLNCRNNVTQITSAENIPLCTFTYTYNEAGFPTAVSIQNEGEQTEIEIRY